jgi:hypothetical protein
MAADSGTSGSHPLSRALWIIEPKGFTGAATDPGTGSTDEGAQWSRDSRLILFVRRSLDTGDGRLYLLPVSTDGRPAAGLRGPLADLGSYPGQNGSPPWSDGVAWFQAQTS